MARNWYSEAIDIINSDTDFKKIVIELAKRHPKFVVDAAAIAIGKSWQEDCLNIRKGQGLIHAIKHCRKITGMGLIEAKKAVDAL